MEIEDFRRYGHQLIDRIADYHAGIAKLPVMAQVAPGDLKSALPKSPPDKGEAFDAVFADLDRLILPGLSHFQHPGFFGYFPANAELSSVLGDYLSSGLGVIGLSWQSSPALTELEEVTVDWLRQMVGLSDGWSGVIHDTASSCTLVALISAREKASNYALVAEGMQGAGKQLVIYVSDHAHSSVEKAALLAGFGKAHIHRVAVDADFALLPEALREAIAADRASGLTPCAIVATTGTTTTTAIDPLEPIGKIATAEKIWLHVDSAMAGSAMILPECRWMWRGIEQADSIVFNAHKWLGAVFDCSLYYVRDPQHLIRVMSTNPSYLQSNVDGEVKNLRDWGIPLGRRFRALKLWCLLRSEGVAKLQARLRRDLENAKWLEAEVKQAPDWRVLNPVQLQTLCVRHEPGDLTGEDLDRHTLAWADAVNRSGAAYLTPATLDGRWMVRISIGAIPTEREHVVKLWSVIRKMAEPMHATA